MLRKDLRRPSIDWVILAYREAWPSERGLPGRTEPWKWIQEIQQILRELGMRVRELGPLILEDLGWATFTAGEKAEILQCAPSTCQGTLLCNKY